MDDSLRRLALNAAIAAFAAGGAAAQSLPASEAHLPIIRPPASGSPHISAVPGAPAGSRPIPLPAVETTARSGARLGMPAASASMQRRSNPLALVLDAAPTARSAAALTPGAQVGPAQLVAPSLTSMQLWRRGEQLTQEAELALRRGAVHSSREGALEALRTYAAAADMRGERRDAAEALEQATTAIREAGDFVGRYGHVDAADLQRMVDAHQTPVLKGGEASRLNPQAAADLYLDFARQRLTEAAGGRREAAAALAVLARAERLQEERMGARVGGDARAVLAEAVAITYLRAALGTDPGSGPLANELGHQAMRLGLLGEAQWALERSWALGPNEPALRNLIETHRRAGNVATAQELAAILPQLAADARSAVPQVVQLDPGHFAAISPPLQSPAAGVPAAVEAQRSVASAGPAEVARPLDASDATCRATERSGSGAAHAGEVAPAADVDAGVMGRMAGAMRRMWQ